MKEHTPSAPSADQNIIVHLPTSQIYLDPENPRLAWRQHGQAEEELIKTMWTQMAVDEVAMSIAQNGFLPSEPLFVIIANPEEDDFNKRRYIAIEGNRRLTAVKLLLNTTLRTKLKATDLPIIDTQLQQDLQMLPAIIYPDRESLWEAIGFRHINGIKPWDSYSKAQYVAEVHEQYGVPLSEIAKSIGDKHNTVKRLYRGYKILQQAETQTEFNVEDTKKGKLYFSHLYTAADQKEFQDFLGISGEQPIITNPVPQEKVSQLDELMTWLYGKKSKGIEPLIKSQNPDLNILRGIIAKEEAVALLRAGFTLEVAYDAAEGDRKRFHDSINKAFVEIRIAKSTITIGYEGSAEAFEKVKGIKKILDSILKEMQTKIDETSK